MYARSFAGVKRFVDRALALIWECYWVDSVTYAFREALGPQLRPPDGRLLNIYWKKWGGVYIVIGMYKRPCSHSPVARRNDIDSLL